MPTRSQRHKRAISSDGLDAGGWDGSIHQGDTALPITPTHPASPTIDAKLVDSFTGDPKVGTVVSFATSDAAVMTVNASDTTDAAGEYTVTVTTVGAGSANVLVTYPNQGNKPSIKLPVVVSV